MNENVLVRTGRGTYAKVMKQVFSPQPIEEVKEVYGLLQSDFPFAKYDIFANLTQEAEYHRIGGRLSAGIYSLEERICAWMN